jgi:hypothetical protein
VLRRSEGTRFSSPNDDEVGDFQSAIRARDVRAADLQEEPTKRFENRADLRHDRFVGSDEDGGFGEQRSERSEPSDEARRSERSNQYGRRCGIQARTAWR